METVTTSASFREPLKRRRCLIPARGWYEWQEHPAGTQPWYFHAADGSLLAFAGLWDRWKRDGQVVESCTIIVGEPDVTVRQVHDRQPFVISKESQAARLSPHETHPANVLELLQPAVSGAIAFHRVGKNVGNAKNEGPELIEPA